LVGRGPHRDRVRAALAEAKLGRRFHWLSALPFAANVFHEFDLYVLPSRYEGGPYTPLEAMRAGTPVVLTDVAGNADTVEDGVSGLLVGMDDSKALGDAIAYLMSDRQRREAIVEAAHRRLAAKFDVRTMGQETARVYEELVDSRRLTAGSRRGGVRELAVR
ncbi:MAG TPA: glycosyltransferase family 4 protein, partial [Solirubrobacteraceae bacterium]